MRYFRPHRELFSRIEGEIVPLYGHTTNVENYKMRQVIRKFLRVKRAERNLSQEKLSKLIKVNRSNYARYEATGVIQGDVLIDLVVALGSDMSELDKYISERKRELERTANIRIAKEILGDDYHE